MAAIRALDLATVRLLGSSLTITSPAVLVKELIENAIDAQATSIEINLSPNTVDKIQVRDNGQGIGIDDYEKLGRRAHTSKLRVFSELRERNFETLGFRGEALASANTIGTVTITTRTAEDPIATRLILTPSVGGVKTRSPASGAVGTMVKVERLFETVPVRKQQALKESRKCIARIQNLLQAYAMARPQIKLSMRVLKESKYNWDYAPSLTPSTRDAAMQLFGKALAIRCEPLYAEAYGEGSSKLMFTVEALLPQHECDLKSVNGKGAYISVDSRPLSSSEGLGKKIASIFKSKLKASGESDGPLGELSAPFVQVNIRCARISYDFNISLLKDDVLFAEEEKVLSLFEKMCRGFYETENSEQDAAATLQTPPDQEEPLNQSEDQGQSQMLEPLLPTPQPQREDDVHFPPAYHEQMRTLIKVDLGRTLSTESDEDSLLDAVTVLVPSKPLKPEKCSTKSVDKVAIKPLQQQASQDIHRYFKPIRQRSFEIATDDTATEERPPDMPDSPESTNRRRSESRRQPLRPLMESVVNSVDTELDEDLQHHVFEPELPVPFRRPPTPRTWALPNQQSVAMAVSPRDGARLASASPYSPRTASPLSRNPPMLASSPGWATVSPRPRVANDLFPLQTPPSSNTGPAHRRLNLPFRPPIFHMDDHQTVNRPGIGGFNDRSTISSDSSTERLRPPRVAPTIHGKSDSRSGTVGHNPLSFGGSDDEDVSEPHPTLMRT
jgi:DNA mismatch repair protein MutL